MGHVSVSDPSIIENQPHELSIVYTIARIIWQWYISENPCTVEPGRVWVMYISIHSLSILSFKSFKIAAQGLFVSLFVSVNKTGEQAVTLRDSSLFLMKNFQLLL